ncbi:MAG: hypothetical protein LBV07_05590 [Syntrophobacterales bacterium]|nr:hypothetical protein [Syntrophobacterales bacterium]
MVKKWPGDTGQEVSVACEEVLRITMPGISRDSLPDIKRLLQANVIDAKVILGRPFHCYEYGGENICFFRQNSPIVIHYNKDGGLPAKILFNLTGIKSAEDIPAILGVVPASPALEGPVGPYWNDINGVRQLESHNPDFKYEGYFIYPIILHIDKSPIPCNWKQGVNRIINE